MAKYRFWIDLCSRFYSILLRYVVVLYTVCECA